MGRIIKALCIPALGCAIVLGGFVYDVLFAGIPYQDPTPALQARWEFHRAVARFACGTGWIVLLGGLVSAPIIWRTSRRGSR